MPDKPASNKPNTVLPATIVQKTMLAAIDAHARRMELHPSVVASPTRSDAVRDLLRIGLGAAAAPARTPPVDDATSPLVAAMAAFEGAARAMASRHGADPKTHAFLVRMSAVRDRFGGLRAIAREGDGAGNVLTLHALHALSPLDVLRHCGTRVASDGGVDSANGFDCFVVSPTACVVSGTYLGGAREEPRRGRLRVALPGRPQRARAK